MNLIATELKEILYRSGANLVGFANLESVIEGDMLFGVSVAAAYPPDVIKSICNGPDIEYFNEYHKLNKLLDNIVTDGAEFLISKGYKAYAQTMNSAKLSGDNRSALPHKTVATRAGIGWIGKSALLVTAKYGSAVRISSLLTNAQLPCSEAIEKSLCGNCMLCTNSCPGKAISGLLWDVSKDRDVFYNHLACRKKARELSALHLNKEITLCGKCIEICPYTQKYLSERLIF